MSLPPLALRKSAATRASYAAFKWLVAASVSTCFLLWQGLSSFAPRPPIPAEKLRVVKFNMREHVAETNYDLLNKQLRHLDGEGWQLLGGVEKTGAHLYEEMGPQSEAREANIAFFVQVAPANIVLVPRLVSRIWHPRNVYCLHIDTKVPLDVAERLMSAIKANPQLSNVYFMPRSPVTYAGVSMLLNTLDSMHSLLLTDRSWDYYINLSGADYPLISSTALRRLLGLKGVRGVPINFVHYARNILSWNTFAGHRLGVLHFDPALGFDPNHPSRLMETTQKHPVVLADNIRVRVSKGESWVMVHRSFCEFAAHGNVARRLLALFSNMQSPSEHFFQTLGWNHLSLNRTVARHSFREVVWSINGFKSLQHPYHLDRQEQDGSWPFWPVLAQSPNFFARKFHTPDSSILDHIDFMKSGATAKQVNYSAVAQSFHIVKNRFRCIANLPERNREAEISTCFRPGWRSRECKSGDYAMCVGDLPGPLRGST